MPPDLPEQRKTGVLKRNWTSTSPRNFYPLYDIKNHFFRFDAFQFFFRMENDAVIENRYQYF